MTTWNETLIENEQILKNIKTRQHKLNELSRYLSELESQLALIFAASPDIIVFLSKDLKILKISDAVTSILGYKKEELVNQSIYKFICDADINKTEHYFDKLSKKQMLYPIDFKQSTMTWITKDNHKVKLAWRFSVYDERETQIIGIASHIRSYKKVKTHKTTTLFK